MVSVIWLKTHSWNAAVDRNELDIALLMFFAAFFLWFFQITEVANVLHQKTHSDAIIQDPKLCFGWLLSFPPELKIKVVIIKHLNKILLYNSKESWSSLLFPLLSFSNLYLLSSSVHHYLLINRGYISERVLFFFFPFDRHIKLKTFPKRKSNLNSSEKSTSVSNCHPLWWWLWTNGTWKRSS